ncbi:TonB C-terminal domain-containing protein [Thiovibrio sp. JS02]
MPHFYLPSSEDPEKQWRISMLLAIGMHLLIFLVGYFAPKFFSFRPKIQEVQTVNLFTVQDIRQSAPAAAPARKAPAPEPKPEAKKKAPEPVKEPEPVKAEPVKKTEPVKAEPVAKNTISLKPIKKKDKADIEKVKKLREKLLAEEKAKKAKADADKAKTEAEKAKAVADKARADAEAKLKSAMASLKQSLKAGQVAGKGGPGATGTSATATGTGPGAGSGAMVEENLRRYLLAVNEQIQENWRLPDLQSWKDDLEAIVVIRVRRDGVVINKFFEKKSDNIYFNQFVEKTLKDSSPLPAFPVGLEDEEMEIGLKFRPGEVL